VSAILPRKERASIQGSACATGTPCGFGGREPGKEIG
jgi:hypothetical protein